MRGTPLYEELMVHPFASKIFAKAEQAASLGVVDASELAHLAVFLASQRRALKSGRLRVARFGDMQGADGVSALVDRWVANVTGAPSAFLAVRAASLLPADGREKQVSL